MTAEQKPDPRYLVAEDGETLIPIEIVGECGDGCCSVVQAPNGLQVVVENQLVIRLH